MKPKFIKKDEIREIRAVLNGYRVSVEGFVERYDQTGARDHAEFLKHKSDWTPEYMTKNMQEARQRNLDAIRPDFEKTRKEATDKVAFYLSTLKRKIDHFYLSESDPAVKNRLMGYTDRLYKCSMGELDLMAQNCRSYDDVIAFRLYIDTLRKAGTPKEVDNPYSKSGKKAIDKGKTEQVSWNSERYSDILGFSLDKTYKILDDYRELVYDTLHYYNASSKEIFELAIDYKAPEIEKADYRLRYEGQEEPVEDKPDMNLAAKYAAYGINADRFWTQNGDDAIEQEINKINSFITDRTALTEKEQKLLNDLMKDVKSYDIPEKVKELASISGELSVLFSMSDKYSQYLE